MTTPVDPGLQPERTELAWRRTALAIGIGSLLALRLLPHAFGSPLWALGGVVGLGAAGVLWVQSRRRSRRGSEALAREGFNARMPGAGLLFALATLAVVAAVVGAAIVLVTATL